MDLFYPLGNFQQNLDSIQKPVSPLTPVNFDAFNIDHFIDSMNRIDQLSDLDLYTVLKNNIDLFVKNVLGTNQEYSRFLVNPRFIQALTRVMSSIPIDHDKKTCCNKITYDYMTSDNPNEEIKNAFLNLSHIVNRDYVALLVGLGLSEQTADRLVMCRFSSNKEQVNTNRLNFAIYSYDEELMTDQMIVYIYEKLYDRVNDLFQATMFETYKNEEFAEFGENFGEVYGNVGLALLTIINNMQSDKIRQVVVNYITEWEYRRYCEVRFSLRSLSMDFERILKVVDQLGREGKMVP